MKVDCEDDVIVPSLQPSRNDDVHSDRGSSEYDHVLLSKEGGWFGSSIVGYQHLVPSSTVSLTFLKVVHSRSVTRSVIRMHTMQWFDWSVGLPDTFNLLLT